MSYCQMMPEKKVKKVSKEDFNNSSSYMLLKEDKPKQDNECSINYYNVVLALLFIVFVYWLWMKYA
jgi:hypothetical protein